jgi:Flp pilus assembly pilin Flp
MLRRKNKGQSAIEYSVILIVVMGALLASSNYFKRGIQGRWKSSVDELGDQYDPRTANTSVVHSLLSNTETSLFSIDTPLGLQTTRIDLTNSLELRRGSIAVGAY